ncbi:DNA (cytosine-5-)-methyltransferase [Intestinibacter sp.]|uniref:DNA (cytosine-5-)-methyltransferase n=1 Tax=Intestinibacter sp. TaxID=1965304 RepID=UPI002A755C4D|nr:DNA (cytosine-5-)-methyltransferase [Intestinibacter sp.]MDY2737062.1 DNA (cytosine-5-)-methyltransferase [Intestinibacter sp.]
MIQGQTTIFDFLYPKYKIKKPIRLIELFAGYGSQYLALKYLGANVEHYKICEWAVKSIQAYNDLHIQDYFDYSGDLSDDNILKVLVELGVSINYNEPATREQLKRQDFRKIYNNIIATNNLVNIQNAKGKDFKIVDKDQYDYIMTYSFPCQDLSLAGKGKGMADTSTRSGMLWEVERILNELKELNQLPQVLLMENVPQVHGMDNVEYFNKWQLALEKLGYKNYFQDLIATDYGIPQTRNRCFMVSILGEYSYTFPKPIPLKLKLKDLLEENVDEKYYLSDKMIEFFTKNEEKQKENGNGFRFNVSDGNVIAKTITTRAGSRMDDNFIYNKSLKETLEKNKIEQDISFVDSYNKKIRDDGLSSTITTRINDSNNTFIAIKNATKKGYLEATDGDELDISSRMKHHRGTEQKDKIQTLTTSGGNDRGVCIGTYQYSKSDNFMKGKDRLQLGKEVSDTLQTTLKEGICYNNLRIRKLTPREAFRLMGVKDEDYYKVAKNQSNSSLYHLAGDSLVTLVFCAIMSTMIDNCKSFEQVLEEFYLQISN